MIVYHQMFTDVFFFCEAETQDAPKTEDISGVVKKFLPATNEGFFWPMHWSDFLGLLDSHQQTFALPIHLDPYALP